jgi:hypothetical protein
VTARFVKKQLIEKLIKFAVNLGSNS